MITVPTVLILGAGASTPYGFPTAAGLISDICEMLSEPDSLRFKIVSAAAGNSNEDLTTFRDELEGAGTPSVDYWLEQKENKEFENTGKAAIATFLLKCEKHALLSKRQTEEDWYQVLWKRLIDGATFETFQKNDLHVVTFNYDRSLEQWLFTRMKNFYRGRDSAAKLAESIPIVHVYGSLASLPWQEQDSGAEPIPYDLDDYLYEQQRYGNFDQSTLQKRRENAVSYAMNNIELIPVESEKPTYTKSFNKAREWIEQADALYYLGFGYNQTNMERLGIEALQKPTITMGTTSGIERPEENYLKCLYWKRDLFTRNGHVPVSIRTGEWKQRFPPQHCAEFLKNVDFNLLP